MDDGPASQITLMLAAIGKGDKQAASELLPLIYDELRSLARARLDEPGQTLQPTALVHEAYLKLTAGSDPGWNGRSHFFSAAALAMRHILVDQARRKMRRRRHGARHGLEADPEGPSPELPAEELLIIHEALVKLEGSDARKAQVVNLRYFAGLSEEETAATLGLSTRTVQREWRFAKSWLKRELRAAGDPSGPANEP